MTTETTRRLMEEYFGALSGKPKPAATVDRYVSSEDLKQHIELFEASFPRYEQAVEDMIIEGDAVAARTTFRGTQTGEFQGIAATGRQVTLPVMLFYRLREGKIAEFWMSADVMSLMQQLGALPVAA
jgi:predicted ester cyclase